MSFGLGILLKTTAILLCVGILAAMLRRSSAAARHAVWALGLVGVLAIPIATRTLPTIDLPVLPQAEAPQHEIVINPMPTMAPLPTSIAAKEPASTSAPARSEPSARPWPLRNWVALIWSFGTLVVFSGWIAALFSLRNLARNAVTITDPDWLHTLEELQKELKVSDRIQLRLAEAAAPPMTWGIFRHVILLPAGALEWSLTRRRLVLAHELAHIKRVDSLGQILAQCVCSFYWFNPMVWYAVHRLQIERERACDDYVLRLGASAVDYADHLLQIARGLNTRFMMPAVTMAQPSQLNTRMVAILDPQMRRQTLSRAASMVLLILVGILTLSTATVQVTAMATLVLPEAAVPRIPFLTEPSPTAPQAVPPQAAPLPTGGASIEGRIVDATTGDPITEVEISTPQQNGVPRVVATTNAEGRFTIQGLAAGSYSLTTNKEGYARLRSENRKAPGNPGVWITVRDHQALKDVVLWLQKSGVVTGRVFDTHGRPVSGAEVTLVRAAYDRYGERELTPHGTAHTNDRGEFRAFGLEAGEYYARVVMDNEPFMPPPGGETFEEAFYPGVPDIAEATLVKVGWGDEIRLGDTTVQAVKTVPIRMRIVNDSGAPESGIRSFTLYRNGQLMNSITSGPNLSGGTGRFELMGLAPGTYDIAVGWGGNDKMTGVRRTFELTGTEVTGDLVVRKAPLVSGKFLMQQPDGTLQPIAASVRLEKWGFQLSAVGNAEGAFSIPAVPEEDYWLRFARLPAGAYVLSMKVDGAAVRADRIRIARDTAIEVVIASGGSAVEGLVRNAKGEKVPNATIAILPDAPIREHGHLYRVGTTDQNGSFAITGVPAGAYHAFAWRDMEGAAYRNPEFMKAFEERGSALKVTGSTAAKVDLLLADEAR